jgi:AcrR family transcriptional regulator
MSLREQNKRDKEARIREAAKTLFHQKGFAATTTREIAEAASVGTGTLFLYARSKEELLLLVWRDEIAAVLERAQATMPQTDILCQLVHLFGAFFDFYAEDPALARVYVRELLFPEQDPANTAGFTMDFLDTVGGLLEAAAARKELAPIASTQLLSSTLFGCYILTLIGCLNGMFPFAGARAMLEAGFSLQLRRLS